MNKLVVFILTVMFPFAAVADNCDNPKDDFDGLYCLNKVYQEADKELNSSYKTLRTFLNAGQKEKLVKTQRAWIEERNSKCSYRDEENGFFVNLDCTAEMTISRTNELNDRIRECKATGCQESKL
ncbi:MAG: hypothetical protein CSB24_00465 [Deltaproteobacteria bacterium]|nr:MAG: hypothetical protein CSB24_00465 [Deltaproteobacteria bacterium]